MEEIFEEYVTFHVTASDGSDVEMAVVDGADSAYWDAVR